MPSGTARGRLYLHVGAPKCGSTYLQGLLWSNREGLEAAGVGLPGVGAFEHYRASRDVRGVPFDPEEPGGEGSGTWDLLAKKAARRQEDICVISDEQLGAAAGESLTRIVESLASREVHVVLVLRPLTQLLPSAWQEVVKHRGTEDYPTWVSRVVANRRRPFWRHHDTEAVLSRWSEHVPADRIHVVTMPRPDQGRRELWNRFAAVLGVDPALAATDDVQANRSLGYAETEFIRRLNGALPSDVERWHHSLIVRELVAGRILGDGLGGPPPPLPTSLIETILERQDEIIRAISTSGCTVSGSLEELRTGPPPGSAEALDPDVLLEAAVRAAAGLVAELALVQDRSRQSFRSRMTERVVTNARARSALSWLEGRSPKVDAALAGRAERARSRVRAADRPPDQPT